MSEILSTGDDGRLGKRGWSIRSKGFFFPHVLLESQVPEIIVLTEGRFPGESKSLYSSSWNNFSLTLRQRDTRTLVRLGLTKRVSIINRTSQPPLTLVESILVRLRPPMESGINYKRSGDHF